MNSRQRTGALMMVAALLLGIVAFFVAAGYTAQVDAQVGKKVKVYVVDRDLPAFSELKQSDVRSVSVPAKWVGAGVLRDSSFLGRKTFVALPSGAYVEDSTLVPVQDLKRGEREIAINVDAESGVGGRIQPGDYVNVNVTLQSTTGDTTRRAAAVMIRNVRVISIGGRVDKLKEDGERDAVVPVTFALTEAESLRLLYSESFATAVRLSKVPVGDNGANPAKPFGSPGTFSGLED